MTRRHLFRTILAAPVAAFAKPLPTPAAEVLHPLYRNHSEFRARAVQAKFIGPPVFGTFEEYLGVVFEGTKIIVKPDK